MEIKFSLSDGDKTVFDNMKSCKPVFWINSRLSEAEKALSSIGISLEDMKEAEERWQRFAPLISTMFPETADNDGIIESDIVELSNLRQVLESEYPGTKGSLFLKCDYRLPVAGSIKARGGIYEVLKYAEKLATENDMLSKNQDYSVMVSNTFKSFFSKYTLAVGSTGNLGLSIGIMGSALGFRVNVHMSADAKEWKKALLRSRGVNVFEYSSDYSKAVEEGRKLSEGDPFSYFIDDENSTDLFLGYSTAAFRLKQQLDLKGIKVGKEHPLFVYIPCGVGGAPGGICFGLKNVFGDSVHCFFVEPTHSPCMLLGLLSGLNEKISVRDIGLDNITEADGLAVARPSGFVGKTIERLISGVYTVADETLFELLALLKDCEDILLEPSAAPGLIGALKLCNTKEGRRYIENNGLKDSMENSTHIAWSTGGSFVPEKMLREFYDRGKGIKGSI
ncbi:MAG: D-serine ammonia-lyase [Bacillota bacterium]